MVSSVAWQRHEKVVPMVEVTNGDGASWMTGGGSVVMATHRSVATPRDFPRPTGFAHNHTYISYIPIVAINSDRRV